jgi:tRNA (guanosine-2'-O-)-methyltransferase
VRIVSDAIDRAIEKYGADTVCTTLAVMLTPERIARIDAVLAARLTSVVTIVEDTYDPHNMAATIRTTEALGLHELHAIEPGEERFSAAWGITRGSHKWIDLRRGKDPVAAVTGLRERGFRIYATLPGATETIHDVDVHSPIAIAFGNEHAGLSQAAIGACDGAIGVPMYGFTESFNLSVTVGMAMSTIAARRRAVLGRLGDLPDERLRYLRARWFAAKIRGADEVFARLIAAG